MIIKPLKKRCKCGKAVKNHHFLCDKCHGERQKNIHFLLLKGKLMRVCNTCKSINFYKKEQWHGTKTLCKYCNNYINKKWKKKQLKPISLIQ